MMILAVVQMFPKEIHRLVRVDTFASFQSICGMIESESYLAAHAACHGKMNGMSRILAAQADIKDLNSVQHAIEVIFSGGSFDALVIPGLTDEAAHDAVCQWCLPHAGEFDFQVFLDPPRQSSAESIVRHQKTLPRFATLCWPYASAVTPGRRSAEILPPSCFIAPLALRTASHLRSVCDLLPVTPDDAALLDENGVAVMRTRILDRRPVITCMHPKPAVPAPHPSDCFAEIPIIATPNSQHTGLSDTSDGDNPEAAMAQQESAKESAIEAQILAEIEANSLEIIKQHAQNSAALWSSLTRTAISVLKNAQTRGLIKSYRVRCDEETASWGTPEAPVVEILLTFPKRVKQARFQIERHEH